MSEDQAPEPTRIYGLQVRERPAHRAAYAIVATLITAELDGCGPYDSIHPSVRAALSRIRDAMAFAAAVEDGT